MDNLSGGEKTVAALALLFAIHRCVCVCVCVCVRVCVCVCRSVMRLHVTSLPPSLSLSPVTSQLHSLSLMRSMQLLTTLTSTE